MPDVPAYVLDWARQREEHRRNRDFPAADALRGRIAGAGFEVADTPQGPVLTPARRYTRVAPSEVPDRRGERDTVDVSVLLLLDDPRLALLAAGDAAPPPPPWVVDDARRCLASVLRHAGDTPFEVVILDNGLGGAAGDWAADAARNAGIEAVHLGQAVGFGEARGLQHRAATGKVLLWLDTGVEVTGDLFGPLLGAFDDPRVALVGRWGGELAGGLEEFHPAQPLPSDSPPRRVDAVWGYLLGLRRAVLHDGAVEPRADFRFYRNADADLSLQVLAAGHRAVLVDLPAVQHVHRGHAEPDPAAVGAASRHNWRLLLDRRRSLMERLATDR
jgi:hypothetical protein